MRADRFPPRRAAQPCRHAPRFHRPRATFPPPSRRRRKPRSTRRRHWAAAHGHHRAREGRARRAVRPQLRESGGSLEESRRGLRRRAPDGGRHDPRRPIPRRQGRPHRSHAAERTGKENSISSRARAISSCSRNRSATSSAPATASSSSSAKAAKSTRRPPRRRIPTPPPPSPSRPAPIFPRKRSSTTPSFRTR